MLLDVAKTLITSLVSIAVLFLLCRMIGQRQISQMSLFDYVNGIVIGSIAAELATNLEDWHRPLTAMLLYGLAAAAINAATCKSLALRKIFNGRPLVLFEDGKLYKGNLYRAKLDINEFLTQCRVAGYFDLSRLEAVVLETNGQLSFLPLAAERPATPADLQLTPPEETMQTNLILDGRILTENLKASGRSEAWLTEQLHRQGIGQVREVFLASCDQQGSFTAYRMLDEPVAREIFE